MANIDSTDDGLTAEQWLSQAIEADRRGDFLAAYDIARRGLETHPNELWLKHRAVLALARSGATEQARAMFRDLGLEGAAEEDIAALDARLAKDHALAAKGQERVARARKAADDYQAIYERPPGYYPGINAATMRLLAGNADAAADLARRVLESCAEAGRREGREDYYLAATRAEAHLLLDDLPAAGEALRRAAAVHDGDYAAVAATRRQLRLICEIKAIDAGLLAPLNAPKVIHYVGHMISAPGEAGRFAAESEDLVAGRIADCIEQLAVGYGFGSLACGADILFAEALLRRKAELHVVLPFDKDEFKQISVARGGRVWLNRFDKCLKQAASVTYATDDSYLGDDELFAYGGRLAMGLALLRATYLDTEVEQIAVWDRLPAEGPAGTSAEVAFWQKRGSRTEVIDCGPAAKGTVTTAVGADLGKSPLRRVVHSMLFGDIKGFSKLPEETLTGFVEKVMGGFATVLDSYGDKIRYRNTWGDAVYVVLPDSVTAATCAMDLQGVMTGLDLDALGFPPDLALRLGGHLGPVFEGHDPVIDRPAFFGTHVSRTARIEPVTPPGEIYVTEPFAAAIALAQNSPFRCEYVGNIAAAKDYGAMRMYVIRRR